MAASFMEIGPKLDWTRDGGIYEWYLAWQKRCKFIFESALLDVPEQVKCSYLKFWLGDERVPDIENNGQCQTQITNHNHIPLIKKWETTNKLVYTRVGEVVPWGYKLTTYWNLLQEEFQPKISAFICVQELWGKSKQLVINP